MVAPLIPVLTLFGVAGIMIFLSAKFPTKIYQCPIAIKKKDSKYHPHKIDAKIEKCDLVDMDSTLFERSHYGEIAKNTIRLRLIENKKVELNRDGFMEVKNALRHLHITDNDVVKFENGAFNDLHYLIWLDLGNNHLQEIPLDLFKNHLPKLEVLLLAGNKLKVLNGADFKQLDNLWCLDLTSNQIERVIGGMPQTVDIYLGYNKLSNLKSADLVGFNINRLDVRRNNIRNNTIVELLKWIRYVKY